MLLYTGLPAPTLCDCFVLIALHRQVPGSLNGAIPCNACEGTVTSDAAWPDVHAKDPNDVPRKGASQLKHCTRCDSPADLAISLLHTLP